MKLRFYEKAHTFAPQDEVVIEFIYNLNEDRVVMGVECDDYIMDEEMARDVAKSVADELSQYVAPSLD